MLENAWNVCECVMCVRKTRTTSVIFCENCKDFMCTKFFLTIRSRLVLSLCTHSLFTTLSVYQSTVHLPLGCICFFLFILLPVSRTLLLGFSALFSQLFLLLCWRIFVVWFSDIFILNLTWTALEKAVMCMRVCLSCVGRGFPSILFYLFLYFVWHSSFESNLCSCMHCVYTKCALAGCYFFSVRRWPFSSFPKYYL